MYDGKYHSQAGDYLAKKHNYKPQPSPLEIDRSTFSGAKDQPQLIRQKIWLT